MEKPFLMQWACQVVTRARTLLQSVFGITSGQETVVAQTSEKAYRINDCGRVMKRSLRPDEYHICSDGERLVPSLVVERLKNEAACMDFIRERTNIPIPKLLDVYEKDGSYFLWMEFVDGVEMSDLTDDEQSKVIPQVQNIVDTLQSLRSSISGGPTGVLSPPSVVYFYHPSEWEPRSSSREDFVFCHGDLSQSNILVDRETLQIVAIIDWEYGGFYPRAHEIPFYESSESSGEQVKDPKHKQTVDNMIEFWRLSQTNLS